MSSKLRCDECGTEFGIDEAIARCRKCRGLLALVRDERPEAIASRFADRGSCSTALGRSGVWRFRELIFPEAADRDIVSFPEGNTPHLVREAVSGWTGNRWDPLESTCRHASLSIL